MINLANYEKRAREAVKAFWQSRESARQRQIQEGKQDQGERAGVTAGKNMDGFITLASEIVRANGLAHADIHLRRRVLTLPGYFRPTKLWDMLIMNQGSLVGAIEFKSQVGPSFGNNFNNRTEEAIGTAVDFWKSYREGAFGESPQPFVGWLMLLEDADGSRKPVRNISPHFATFPEFTDTSYAERYSILCQKLIQEQFYTAASVIVSPRDALHTGDYSELGKMTNLTMFVTNLASHVAGEAVRSQGAS